MCAFNMEKLWTGRLNASLNSAAEDFNSSIRTDSRMFREDIEGSQAHAKMLAECGIITKAEAELIVGTLAGIRADIEAGRLEIDMGCEDIHSFVEKVLTERAGDAGKSCTPHAAATIRLPPTRVCTCAGAATRSLGCCVL